MDTAPATSKPQAHVKQRQLFYIKEGKAPGTRGPRGGTKMPIPDAFETVRSARCSLHDKSTNSFEGVNADGWVFRCPGWAEADIRQMRLASPNTNALPGIWHYFTATAPE